MTSRQHTTRITAGSLRYRLVRQPGEGTRPVAQKVRQAIFNVLGDDLTGLSVLDLYAGSGALGFEALSRGAERLTSVESARGAVGLLQANVRELEIVEKVEIVARDVGGFLASASSQYDLVFLDPPYAKLNPELIEKVSRVVAPGGTLVVSCGSDFVLPEQVAKFKLLRAKMYGVTQIGYYK